MEVVHWDEVIEEGEAEETEVSLRPRLPRHHSSTSDNTNTETQTVTTSKDDNSTVKSSETSSSDGDESRSSEDGEQETNGKPSNGVFHGDGNGVSDAKRTNGHSQLDDRYVDFLVSEENPAEAVVNNSEANDLNLVFQRNDEVLADHHNVVEIEEDNKDLAGFGAPTSHEENGVHASSVSKETVRYMEAELRKKIEAEFKELYLEKLSDRQGQHEFYCPNCKACITKVLVREPELEAASAAPQPERSVERRFRCTSCFSFLIPLGNWLFPSWKIAEEDEEENESRQVSSGGLREPLLDQNIQPVSGKTPVVADVTVTHEHNTEYINGVKEPVLSRDWTVSLGDQNIQAVSSKTPEPTQPAVTSVTATIATLEHNSEHIAAVVGPAQSQPWTSVLFSKKIQGTIKGRTPVTEEPIGVTVPAQTKPSQNDSDAIGIVKEQAPSDDTNETGKAHDHPVGELAGTVVSAAILPLGSNLETGIKVEVSVPPQEIKGESPDNVTPVLDQFRGDIVIVQTKPSEIDVVAVSKGEFPLLQEVIIHGGPKLDAAVEGVDAGLAVAVLPDTGSAVVVPRDTTLFSEQDSPKSWEIVKSMVYGGLVESITSLGIVTSAASGDATTLNIVVLALANLIGGLFVIAHNIWDLRDEQSTMRCSRTSRLVDKYHEVLGRRENFVLHATFVILSFLLFGLVPPVVYGLTFRESDDKDLKLAAVGVASLICIAILAVGKAYIQRPNKYIKTIIYYLVIGFGVSGASYLAGELIRQLLEKINSSESTLALAMPLSGTGTSKGAWGSY